MEEEKKKKKKEPIIPSMKGGDFPMAQAVREARQEDIAKKKEKENADKEP